MINGRQKFQLASARAQKKAPVASPRPKSQNNLSKKEIYKNYEANKT